MIPAARPPIWGRRDGSSVLPAVEPPNEAHAVCTAPELLPARHPGLHPGASVALYLAVRPARPQAARPRRNGAAAARQDRDARGAVHVQMGDRRARLAGPPIELLLARLRDRASCGHDGRLRRDARPDGGAHPGSRRGVRQGGDARGQAARADHLRAYASVAAALPSRAQDRRADPRARARAQRHRDHRPHGDPAARADHRRGRADRRGAALSVRLALRRGDPGHCRALHVVHLLRHRVAHQHPPPDERERYRRQHQGDRIRCSTTRR